VENKDILKILSNLGFNITQTAVGSMIAMSPEEAFLFSSISGAQYLITPNGVSFKGRSEVFIHRSVFSNGYLIYSPGLFSRTIEGFLSEGNSSDRLFSDYPNVFNNDKLIYIKDINQGEFSNIESSCFKELKLADLRCEDVVLYKNFLYGGLGEPLLEYLACKEYINKGYLVENQVPWFQQSYKYNGKVLNGGTPDFAAFHSSISSKLYELGLISGNKGIAVNLLPYIKLFRRNFSSANAVKKIFNYELIIGEAKTSKNSAPQAVRQLDKYRAVDLAEEFYTIVTDCENNDSKYGEMFIKDHHLTVNKVSKVFDINTESRVIDNHWIDLYVKMLLLGNFAFDSILNLIRNFRIKNNLTLLNHYEACHLLDAIQNISNDEFINLLIEEF